MEASSSSTMVPFAASLGVILSVVIPVGIRRRVNSLLSGARNPRRTELSGSLVPAGGSISLTDLRGASAAVLVMDRDSIVAPNVRETDGAPVCPSQNDEYRAKAADEKKNYTARGVSASVAADAIFL
jgi:hypothetical protein